jgi:hypothetical protein
VEVVAPFLVLNFFEFLGWDRPDLEILFLRDFPLGDKRLKAPPLVGQLVFILDMLERNDPTETELYQLVHARTLVQRFANCLLLSCLPLADTLLEHPYFLAIYKDKSGIKAHAKKFSKAIEDGQYRDFPLLTDVYAVSHERLHTLIPDASLPNLHRKSAASLVKVLSPLIRKGFDNEDKDEAEPKKQGEKGEEGKEGEAPQRAEGVDTSMQERNEEGADALPHGEDEDMQGEESSQEGQEDLFGEEGNVPSGDEPKRKGREKRSRAAVLGFLPARINEEEAIENPMERESSPVKKRKKAGNFPDYQHVDWKSWTRCNDDDVPKVQPSIVGSATLHQMKMLEAAQAMVDCGHCVTAYLLFHNKKYHERKLTVANQLTKHLETHEFKQCMKIWKDNSGTETQIPSDVLRAFIGVLSVFPWDIFVAALFAGLRGNGNVGCSTEVGTVGHLACKIVSPLNFEASWKVFAKLVGDEELLPWNHCDFDHDMYKKPVEGGWDAIACLLPPILTDLVPESARDGVVSDVAVALNNAHRDPFHMLVAKMFKMLLPDLFVNDGYSEKADTLTSSDLAKQVFGADDKDVEFLESFYDNKKVTFSSWRKAFAGSLPKAATEVATETSNKADENPTSPSDVPVAAVTLETGQGSPKSPISPAISHQTPKRQRVSGSTPRAAASNASSKVSAKAVNSDIRKTKASMKKSSTQGGAASGGSVASKTSRSSTSQKSAYTQRHIPRAPQGRSGFTRR